MVYSMSYGADDWDEQACMGSDLNQACRPSLFVILYLIQTYTRIHFLKLGEEQLHDLDARGLIRTSIAG